MYFRSTRTQCQWQALPVSFLYDLWFSFSFYWTENPGHCDNFTGPFFSFFLYFGLFLFHNCTRCLFCVRSVLFYLKCYHSSCPFVWGTIAQSTVSNILRINSFTPWSNQFVIYPYHLDTLSSRKSLLIAVPFYYVRDDWFPRHYPWQLCDPARKNIPIPSPSTDEKQWPVPKEKCIAEIEESRYWVTGVKGL